jgi:TM2 domain-containing membrane protein YozV
MTQQHPDANPAPQDGYGKPAASPDQYPAQPPMPQPPGYSAKPPMPQQPQYSAQPPMPQQPYYSAQPPMPQPGYGYPQSKSKIAAGLLGIFLGALGIHRFYLGYTKIGIIQLVLAIVLSGLGLGFLALWGLIEGIMILAGAVYFQRDAHGVPLRN